MKQYLAYKKQFSILFLAGLLLVPMLFSNAQTAQDIKNKIEQKNTEIEQLEKEIKAYQGQLSTLGAQKVSLAGSIKQLDITRKKLNADISVTQNKIERTNYKIEGLTSDISGKQNSISNNMRAIEANLKRTNELDITSFAETILSKDDFTIIWNDIDNMISVRDQIIKKTSELRQIKGELEDTRAETLEAKKELVALKSQLADQKKVVDQNVADKNKLLKQTQNSEANYQKLLKDQLAKKEAFEKELRNYESQLKFILDPKTLPNAGVLSWPLDSIFVTQQFGAKTGPHRTYASGHSGVDFRARTPLPTKAMADGVVKGTGDTDLACPGASFGKWVLIEYNNGLSSTFGHLSVIKVSEGQKVSRGEVVAYTGGTGRVTGPHLHVSLYASSAVQSASVPSKSCPGRILKQPIAAINAYLDPMYYLPPYNPS